MPSQKTHVEVITRYNETDAECLSDYCEVVVMVDGKQAARYMDEYHERGRERADGFVDGVRAILGDAVEVTRTNVADYPV